MEKNEFDEKLKYAQTIINILQTRLNENVAQNVQLEATVTVLREEKEKLKAVFDEKLKKELVDAGDNKTKKE